MKQYDRHQGWRSLQEYLHREWQIWAIPPSATVFALALNFTGLLQGTEWAAQDLFFCLRPPQPVDQRIVVITIDDQDITDIGKWPIPDQLLANALLKIKAQQPRVVGLDLYRDLPVEPGHDQLTTVFQSMPYLIGIEKRFGGQKVLPSPTLAKLHQVAVADLIEDADGTVRRGLIAGRDDANGQVSLSLGAASALKYLEAEGIYPETDGSMAQLNLGNAHFTAFNGNDGAYVRADDNGYQILMNWQGQKSQFQTFSLTVLLKGQIPPNALSDRLVLIGSAAESVHDFFRTPYTQGHSVPGAQMPGLFIHANLASQIIRTAQGEQSFIKVLPDFLEGAWVLVWALLGLLATGYLSQPYGLTKLSGYVKVSVAMIVIGIALWGSSYLLFLGSWWVPIVAPSLGLVLSTMMSLFFYNQRLQRLAYVDSLTQVANRRYFDQFLVEQSHLMGHLSLILCDVDCFKAYNDTYGHQAGDACLQQIASALRQAVRASDLVCRYGGEEFAVILPHADLKTATQVAERVVSQVRELMLIHSSSVASNYVTLSCGVTSTVVSKQHLNPATGLSTQLIAEADTALYQAKTKGRNRYEIA